MGSCKICDSSQMTFFGEIKSYKIFRCKKCGFGQTNVTESEIQNFYEQEYFAGERAHFSQSDDSMDTAKLSFADRYIPKTAQTVLEIGPGPAAMIGRYLKASRPQVKYVAVEISKYASERIAEYGFEVYRGTIQDGDIQEKCAGSYDCLLATEVIEHVLDPKPFALSLYNALKPGGILCLSTGNFNGGMAKFKGLKWYYLDPPAHVVYYTPRSIRLLLHAAGFRNVRIEHLGFNYLRIAQKFPIPGLLKLVGLTRWATGMFITAKKPHFLQDPQESASHTQNNQLVLL